MAELRELLDQAVLDISSEVGESIVVVSERLAVDGRRASIEVQGAGGSISGQWLNRTHFPRPTGPPVVPTDDYHHHVRVPASKLLSDPIDVARSLTDRLLRTVRPTGFPDALRLSD